VTTRSGWALQASRATPRCGASAAGSAQATSLPSASACDSLPRRRPGLSRSLASPSRPRPYTERPPGPLPAHRVATGGLHRLPVSSPGLRPRLAGSGPASVEGHLQVVPRHCFRGPSPPAVPETEVLPTMSLDRSPEAAPRLRGLRRRRASRRHPPRPTGTHHPSRPARLHPLGVGGALNFFWPTITAAVGATGHPSRPRRPPRFPEAPPPPRRSRPGSQAPFTVLLMGSDNDGKFTTSSGTPYFCCAQSLILVRVNPAAGSVHHALHPARPLGPDLLGEGGGAERTARSLRRSAMPATAPAGRTLRSPRSSRTSRSPSTLCLDRPAGTDQTSSMRWGHRHRGEPPRDG